MGAVAFREMRRGSEAAGERHIDHRHLGQEEQIACPLEAEFHVVAFRGAVEVAAEETLQLPCRHPCLLGERAWTNGLLDVHLHCPDHGDQLGMPHAKAARYGQTLLLPGASSGVEDHVGHHAREVVSIVVGDDLEHHVACRGAARAGVAVPVDLEDVAGKLERREFLGDGRQAFPVDRAPTVVEQASLREDVRPGAQRAQGHAARILAPQPGEDRTGRRECGVDAAADEQNRVRVDFIQAGICGYLDPVRAAHRGAVSGVQAPCVALPVGQAVRDPERLQSGSEGDHRKIGRQEKCEPAWRCRPTGDPQFVFIGATIHRVHIPARPATASRPPGPVCGFVQDLWRSAESTPESSGCALLPL